MRTSKNRKNIYFLISVSRGRCGLRKTEKIFTANNEQGTIKRGEKWFPEKL